MSGDEVLVGEVVLQENEIKISGFGKEKDRIFTMSPLIGLGAIRIVPRFLSMLSRAMIVALRSGIRIDKILLEENTEVGIDIEMILAASNIILEQLSKDWDEFSMEILPALIGAKAKDVPWMRKNGNTVEYAIAIWRAIKFHAPTVLGEEVMEALKKSTAAEETAEDQKTMDSTPNEK